MSNVKRWTEQVLQDLSEEDKEVITQLSHSAVMYYYMLPAQQVDVYHRLFMRTINKNRTQFIELIKEQQRQEAESAELSSDDSEE